jgi:hypothetical protein
MAEEVHAFEAENEMVRRVTSGPGATTPYDWDGMSAARRSCATAVQSQTHPLRGR